MSMCVPIGPAFYWATDKNVEYFIWRIIFIHYRPSNMLAVDLYLGAKTERSLGWLPWSSMGMLSPVTTKAAILTTFPFLCVWFARILTALIGFTLTIHPYSFRHDFLSHLTSRMTLKYMAQWITSIPRLYSTTMMASANGNILRVTGSLCVEFTGHRWIPLTRSVTWSFDVFCDLRLNKQLSKQSWGWWSETPSRSLWRHFNDAWTIWDASYHACVTLRDTHWC